mmetsp:Transcript_7412/g.12523  ORF Transcript_7412/g.12523 Transcript_7412/m.12523 type:complete len:210 (-) Transcript_7412:72-701(-)
MPDYKFYYFPLYARGEPIRMLLAHAKADHENVSITMEEWPKYKPDMPNTQLPALEMADGSRIGQSNSILRLLGMKHGYYPTEPMKAYESDMLCDVYADVIGVMYKPLFAEGQGKLDIMEDIFTKVLPKFLTFLEPILAKGTKFLVGDSLSCADFWIGGLYTNYFNNKGVGYAPERFAELLEKYPNFKAYGERFASEMKEYLESRPVCPV